MASVEPALTQPLLSETGGLLKKSFQPAESILPVVVHDTMTRDSPAESMNSDRTATAGEGGQPDTPVHPVTEPQTILRRTMSPEVELVGCCRPNFSWDDFW